MSGVKKKPTKGGLYQAWFIDYTGKRKYFTALTRSEAKQEAKRLEAEHRLVRDGLRDAPSTASKHGKRPFVEFVDEYLEWGEAQGGRGGRPWGKTHARNRRAHLRWWQDQLGLELLSDMRSALPRVEKQLRSLQQRGRAGKTIANYSEALGALCDWCVQRGYLAEDPLKALAPFDTTPQTTRRAMTREEIGRLLKLCAPHRSLLLETAFLTGLRANELRSLSVADLDTDRCGLHLRAEWTKNRRAGFQPLPRALCNRLHAFAQSSAAADLYSRHYGRRDATASFPQTPLLYVPSHPARALDTDLKAAEIPKSDARGKLDFHACRLAYINLVIESGVTVKEAQELARHSTPELTMNVYGRVREDRLSQAVEWVSESLSSVERVPREYHSPPGVEQESATPSLSRDCASLNWWRRRESNPRPKTVQQGPLRA